MHRPFLHNLLWLPMALVVTACSASTKEPAGSKPPAPDSAPASAGQGHDVANVEVLTVAPGDVRETIVAHGVTAAEHQVVYAAEIAGKLEYTGPDVGDEVKKGTVLARIDFRTVRAQLQQAQTNVDLAQATYARLEKLRSEDLVSQQQFDEARSALESARAQLAIAKATAAKAVVTASRPGIVARKFADKAEFVTPGTPLYEIVDYRTILVEARLPETQVSQVSVGSSVSVALPALHTEVEGTVTAVIPTADPQSKTFTVRIRIPNPDLRILVGMSATVTLVSRVHRSVLHLPQNAVLENGDSRSVFVVEKDRARRRQIHTGVRVGGDVVITSGLQPGDRVVVLGHRDLRDGQPVRVVRAVRAVR